MSAYTREWCLHMGSDGASFSQHTRICPIGKYLTHLFSLSLHTLLTLRRRDIQYNNTQHNEIQHYGPKCENQHKRHSG